MRTAIIDLGTNTCNLLIASLDSGTYSLLYQGKELVKLGDGKIKQNEISQEATSRTIASFLAHKDIIDSYNVDKVVVLATSAVRGAANKVEFLEKIGEASGWLVKVISGEREADLIFKGVQLAFGDLHDNTLVLDIGGGSNELILSHAGKVLWKESQPTGMARVVNSFQISDPIKEEEVVQLNSFFSQKHHQAIQICRERGVKTLIGCSGAFDTVVDLIDGVAPGEKSRVKQEVQTDEFYSVYKLLLQSTRDERLQIKGMDYVRVDLIVPAVILIKALLEKIGIQQIVQTDFALREGVLYEMLRK